jgi:hypothetical protein
MRHIRYNHTKIRPYACAYCNYVAVERDKVRQHISQVHPSELIVVKDRTEANDQFQKFVNVLFKKLVSVQMLGDTSSLDAAVLSLDNGYDSDLDSEVSSSVLSANGQPPTRDAAKGVPSYSDVMGSASSEIIGEHFKCRLCGYCCTDRSCMSRHIKYMHITARPHSCPYCSYNNVEKTKVRLHVKSHHPGRQKAVRTDQKLLEQMSWCAKKFYVRIDHQGE